MQSVVDRSDDDCSSTFWCLNNKLFKIISVRREDIKYRPQIMEFHVFTVVLKKNNVAAFGDN